MWPIKFLLLLLSISFISSSSFAKKNKFTGIWLSEQHKTILEMFEADFMNERQNSIGFVISENGDISNLRLDRAFTEPFATFINDNQAQQNKNSIIDYQNHINKMISLEQIDLKSPVDFSQTKVIMTFEQLAPDWIKVTEKYDSKTKAIMGENLGPEIAHHYFLVDSSYLTNLLMPIKIQIREFEQEHQSYVGIDWELTKLETYEAGSNKLLTTTLSKDLPNVQNIIDVYGEPVEKVTIRSLRFNWDNRGSINGQPYSELVSVYPRNPEYTNQSRAIICNQKSLVDGQKVNLCKDGSSNGYSHYVIDAGYYVTDELILLDVLEGTQWYSGDSQDYKEYSEGVSINPELATEVAPEKKITYQKLYFKKAAK